MNTFIVCVTVVAIVGIVGATVYKCIQLYLEHDAKRYDK